jgi:UrcA family protein
MRISTSIFSASVMLAALCSGTRADPLTDVSPAQVTGRRLVRYGDLNLNNETDAKIMLQRIVQAAKTACGGHATASSFTGSVDHLTFEACRTDAVSRAVTQLGAPLVTRIYFEVRPQKFQIAKQ